MSISDTIRDAIRQDGRSAYALEVDSGVSRPQITRFLKGERTLTLPAVDALCKVLGLELRPVRRKKGR